MELALGSGRSLRRFLPGQPKRRVRFDRDVFVPRRRAGLAFEKVFQGVHGIRLPDTVRPAAISAGQEQQPFQPLRQPALLRHRHNVLRCLTPFLRVGDRMMN